ncbi:unnamed protein product [Alopecurus aequalis]
MSKGKEHHDWILRRCCGSIAACILTLAVLVGFVVLVIYLALHPSKPSFYLQDIQLRSIDLSDPAISLDVQVTIASWNPTTGWASTTRPCTRSPLTATSRAGYVLLHVKVDGRVKWKVGSWVSGGYHIFVNCPALLSATGGSAGGAFSMSAATAGGGGSNGTIVSLKFTQPTYCTVDV